MVEREGVLSAALRTLNVDPAANMAAVAQAAGISRATLHRHFASREALVTEIGTRSLDRWESRLVAHDVAEVGKSGDPARITACLAGLVDDLVADADDFGFALTDSFMCTSPPLLERSQALFETEIAFYAAAQASGVLSANASPRWIGHAVYGLLVAARDALREGSVARREIGAQVLSTFLDGVRAP